MGKKLKTLGIVAVLAGTMVLESQFHLTNYVNQGFRATKNAVVDVFTRDDEERSEGVVKAYNKIKNPVYQGSTLVKLVENAPDELQAKVLDEVLDEAPYHAVKDAVFEGSEKLTSKDNYQLAKKTVGRFSEEKQKEFVKEWKKTGNFFERIWEGAKDKYEHIKK